MGEDKIEEEPYSLIFKTLKHPLRRKILRMLAEKPRSYSEILEALAIDSGHLSYHIENLGDIIARTKDEKYALSTIGQAAVKLIRTALISQNSKARPKNKQDRPHLLNHIRSRPSNMDRLRLNTHIPATDNALRNKPGIRENSRNPPAKSKTKLHHKPQTIRFRQHRLLNRYRHRVNLHFTVN